MSNPLPNACSYLDQQMAELRDEFRAMPKRIRSWNLLCPECRHPGKPFINIRGRIGYLCTRCPKKLVKKGHEVGMTLSGPRWLGPIPQPHRPQPNQLRLLLAGTLLGIRHGSPHR